MRFLAVLIFFLLLSVLSGSTAQQYLDPVCTDSYAEFERASVGSNVSGSTLRNQLYEAFYAPNHHFPFFVFVTYQLALDNGTKFNLSSTQDCSSELWAWVSSPAFLSSDGASYHSNTFLILTLDYFTEWARPQVTITTTLSPCPDRISDFLSEMTASLQDYALGQIEHKTNLGYVQRGCGLSIFNTVFVSVGGLDSNAMLKALDILQKLGYAFQLVFVWMASAVLLKMTFKEYAQKTSTYSYDTYGMFWGISTTAFSTLGILYGAYIALALNYFTNIREAASQPIVYIVVGLMVIPPVLELPVAIYAARKATVAVPCVIRYPVTVLCCGRRKRAECLMTTIVLWADLVALQLVLIVGIAMVQVLPAAPFTIASNVMLLVLALSCLTNFFSLLFTIFANLFAPIRQRKGSNSMVLQAVVVLPLLLMIMCYGAYFAYMELVTNVEAKNKNNPVSFITSIITPILLGVVGIFLKKFISAWLKWSPQNQENEANTSRILEGDEDLEQGLNTSQTREDDEELLDP